MNCDLCGIAVTEENRGQMTADTVICHECLMRHSVYIDTYYPTTQRDHDGNGVPTTYG